MEVGKSDDSAEEKVSQNHILSNKLLTNVGRIHTTVAESPGKSMAHIEQDSSMSDVVVSSNTRACRNMATRDESIIIDVDTVEYEDVLEQAKTSVRVCNGYTMECLEGKSPHTVYPFALHDTIILPWDYALKNGVMKLFARSCRGLSE